MKSKEKTYKIPFPDGFKDQRRKDLKDVEIAVLKRIGKYTIWAAIGIYITYFIKSFTSFIFTGKGFATIMAAHVLIGGVGYIGYKTYNEYYVDSTVPIVMEEPEKVTVVPVKKTVSIKNVIVPNLTHKDSLTRLRSYMEDSIQANKRIEIDPKAEYQIELFLEKKYNVVRNAKIVLRRNGKLVARKYASASNIIDEKSEKEFFDKCKNATSEILSYIQ
jgi:hypothetical protein